MAERILISDLFRNTWLALTNRVRLLRRRGMDYAVLRITGSFPERTVLPRRRFPLSLLPWPPPPPSVEAFTRAMDRLAGDPRIKGVVLIISGLTAGPATLNSLRGAITRFRESGKGAVAYLHDLSMWPYYLATACDEVLAPESANFRAAGLWSEALFLKDTLALVGLEADFESIAEYKVTPDMLCRSEMSEPHREMLESLLDSVYGEVVGAIAQGRDLEPERVQELLDAVPLTAGQACDAGMLDAICYEDELADHLGTADAPAALITWDQVRRRLVRPRRWHSRRAIGVISLEGMIVAGPSRQPPLPLPVPLPLAPTQAGSDTLVQQLRAAAQDKHLAAVVIHVDSPGGSALASDLIWREVAHLRRTKPVVVYMSNQAASGGYYVSAPANAIVAQPTTLTGSIGIWGGKVVTRGLFERVRARREVVSRGEAAGLYADTAPFSDEERARIRADMGDGYTRFKARVSQGREKTEEEVEAIARGRVWTGEQALAHGLVDELGDLQTAADKARALAGLDARRYAPLVDISTPRRYTLPQQIPTSSGEWLANLTRLFREGTFALAPWAIRIRD
jgi:protease-4